MKRVIVSAALLISSVSLSAPARVDAQAAVGTGTHSICVVSHDATNTFYASKLSTDGDATKGEAQYARFLAWLVKEGKATGQEAGNCYFNDDSNRLTAYVQHLDDGCDDCARWTMVETEWTPAFAE